MESATGTRSGNEITAAIRRGTTRYLIGIGGERGQRVDLLGHAHGADFGGDGGGDAARNHQPRDHRPQLARDAEHDDLRHEGFRAEAVAADDRSAAPARRR